MKKNLFFMAAMLWFSCACGSNPYHNELKIPYCTVDGITLTLNAFLPENTDKPVPAMVQIHGGWFMGGEPVTGVPDIYLDKNIAYFSVEYRLGEKGGFPQCIRDCRNAIRFIRKNAERFNIDPDRIGVMGTSAGGLLSLMVAMVPEDFDDGGPTEGLEGISARVCNCHSNIPPTDLVRFWNQCPSDTILAKDGTITYRGINEKIPNDGRPRLRILFKGQTPEAESGKELFIKMSPITYVRKDLPPILISEGTDDPIVPGYHGQELYNQLIATEADATYWRITNCGHCDPNGPEFQKLFEEFLSWTFKL